MGRVFDSWCRRFPRGHNPHFASGIIDKSQVPPEINLAGAIFDFADI